VGSEEVVALLLLVVVSKGHPSGQTSEDGFGLGINIG
jgi:hypothetical protein